MRLKQTQMIALRLSFLVYYVMQTVFAESHAPQPGSLHSM